MGEQQVAKLQNTSQANDFIQAVLTDIKALDKMYRDGLIESDVQRIGAEQELCFVNSSWRPAPLIEPILKELNDPHFTTELSKFNAEINLEPFLLEGDCLEKMERQLKYYLLKIVTATHKFDSDIILVGILPTIRRMDLEMDNLTPRQRYRALFEILRQIKGGPFEYHIRGVEELVAKQEMPTFEFCNTSFQIHLQVSPHEFISQYNLSQAIAGPVLAGACNSPLLLGKRLWRETRIALFQQAVDTRNLSHYGREKIPRVSFANNWIKDSLLNTFKDDVARYRILLTTKISEDSLQELEEGNIPKLSALCVFISTVYRWNRACYGVSEGKPHLRIENRMLPSGPTVIDQMANAAFWFGLMKGLPEIYPDITKVLEFENVQANFAKAAQIGLDSQFRWVNDSVYPADELIVKELIPVARSGLQKVKINTSDIDKYLTVIEERVKSRKTGARWIVASYNKLQREGTREESLVALTAGIVSRQKKGIPVHRWNLANIDEGGTWMNKYWHVEQLMTTELFTVHKEDLVDLATHIMDWKYIRHVPVEDEKGELVGLITSGLLLHHYTTCVGDECRLIPVEKIMIPNPVTVTPETLTTDAVKIMREKKIGCLPVVRDGKLVGIVTEHDFMKVSARLLEEMSAEAGPEQGQGSS